MLKVNFDPCAFPGACCPDCSVCRQSIGVFQCQGCCKIFCTRDSNGHRQELRGELQQIIDESEQYNAYWGEEMGKRQRMLRSRQDKVIEEINDWEMKAMAKIKQVSAEAREQTSKLFEHHKNIYPECPTLDATALKHAMDTDGFLEMDLEKWRKNLQCWKSRDTSFETNFIRLRECEAIISKLVVEGEYTRHVDRTPCVQHEPCIWRSPCIPGDSYGYARSGVGVGYTTGSSSYRKVIMVPVDRDYDPCHQRDFRSGARQYRYKIQCVCRDCSSKNVYVARGPCDGTSQYGWQQVDQNFVNAHANERRGGCHGGVELNDTYLLVMDCNRRSVCLTNERTNKSYALDIDPLRDTLPKQLHVRFIDD